MSRAARRKSAQDRARRQSIIVPLSGLVIVVAAVVAFYQLGTSVPEMDDRLCPKDNGPSGATVLLLDTSDPLTSKHQAELKRLAGQIVSEEAGPMGIAPQELLAVYELTHDPGAPRKLIEVCRPMKSPQDRTWRDDIKQGRRFADRDWTRFEEALANGFPEDNSESRPVSPLLETISVLAPRYVPGKRHVPDDPTDEQFEVHLVVFSDLLQHSERFSHYEPYPDAKEMQHKARDLLTDLTGVRVSLFRLERPRYAKWQTKRHYYWWAELINTQGGQIGWQESI